LTIVAKQVAELTAVDAARALKGDCHGFTDFVEAGNRVKVRLAERRGRGSTGADCLVDRSVAGCRRGEHPIDHRSDG
jgi:hypothetical protein